MVKPKRNRYVCQSRMCDKSKKNTINKLKEQIKMIKKHRNSKEVSKLNSIILGIHNYYNAATYVSTDFQRISFLVAKTLEIRLKNCMSDKPKISETYKRLYGMYGGKIRTIHSITIYPIYGCKTKPPMNFNQNICNYTENGRLLIHSKLKGYNHLIKYLLKYMNHSKTAEFNDNMLSLIAGQKGKCYITGLDLETDNMECHRKIPKSNGGTDEYKNLVWLCAEAHTLIHCNEKYIIRKYLGSLVLDEKGLKRVNSLRKLVGNSAI